MQKLYVKKYYSTHLNFYHRRFAYYIFKKIMTVRCQLLTGVDQLQNKIALKFINGGNSYKYGLLNICLVNVCKYVEN